MGKRGHSEEEILRVLREAESEDTVVEICRGRRSVSLTLPPRCGGCDPRAEQQPLHRVA